MLLPMIYFIGYFYSDFFIFYRVLIFCMMFISLKPKYIQGDFFIVFFSPYIYIYNGN